MLKKYGSHLSYFLGMRNKVVTYYIFLCSRNMVVTYHIYSCLGIWWQLAIFVVLEKYSRSLPHFCSSLRDMVGAYHICLFSRSMVTTYHIYSYLGNMAATGYIFLCLRQAVSLYLCIK
jgi:hypothetical protein